jgi:hypothetical protein
MSSRRLFVLDNNGNAGIIKNGGSSTDAGEVSQMPNSGQKRLCYGNFLLNDRMMFIVGG